MAVAKISENLQEFKKCRETDRKRERERGQTEREKERERDEKDAR